jgi:hypothetical protein
MMMMMMMMKMIYYQLLNKAFHQGVGHSQSVCDSVLDSELRIKAGKYLQILIRGSEGHSSCNQEPVDRTTTSDYSVVKIGFH